MQYVASGFAGLQGIVYSGTNCFLRRKVIYGLSPGHDIQIGKEGLGFTNGNLDQLHFHHLTNSKMNGKLYYMVWSQEIYYFIYLLAGTLSEKEIIQTFGTSRGFIESAEHALIRREDIC